MTERGPCGKQTGRRSKEIVTPLRALIVEDSQNDCDLLLGMLTRGGYEVTHKRVCSAAALLAVLEESQWDIVISDYSMPGFKGTDALAMVRGKGLDVPFIFLSGTIGPVLVPSECYFVMGDHRNSSNDSRVFGPIDSRSIYGRAVFAYWPVDRFGSLSAMRTTEAKTK